MDNTIKNNEEREFEKLFKKHIRHYEQENFDDKISNIFKFFKYVATAYGAYKLTKIFL